MDDTATSAMILVTDMHFKRQTILSTWRDCFLHTQLSWSPNADSPWQPLDTPINIDSYTSTQGLTACEGYDLITAPRHRNLRDHSLVSALLKRLAYSGSPRTRRKVRLVAELSVYSDQSLDRNYV